MFTTNDQTPIDGRIYNEDVLITLTNRSQGSNLYDQATPTIVATINGVEFTPEKIEASNTFAWKFSGQGRYKITITSKVADYLSPLQTKEISTTYTFTIINPNQAVSFMSISQSLGFTITKVTKGVNTNYPLTDTHSLILSSTTSGNDMYTVYVSAPVEGYNTTFDFSFQVWINDEVPAIASSIDALSIGITFAEYSLVMMILSTIFISVITFFMCLLGFFIGKKFGNVLGNKSEILGGVILIIIGLEIFVASVI